jgi:uncharacterized integral membrane protein
MKKMQLIPVIVFFIFVFYFAILNWNVFIQKMEVSFGFGQLNLPIVMVLFIIAIFFLFIQSGIANLIESRYTRTNEKKEKEITSVKSNLYDKSAPEIESMVANLGYLDAKLDRIMEKLDLEPGAEEPEKPETPTE